MRRRGGWGVGDRARGGLLRRRWAVLGDAKAQVQAVQADSTVERVRGERQVAARGGRSFDT